MCFHNLFTTSSTFSLVEVTAEYLDSQASCTLPCIFVLCSIMDKNPSAVSPSLPQTLTWGWLQAPDSAWKPWYCPTGLMQHMPWHNLCCHKLPSVSSPHTEKKNKNSVLHGIFRKFSFFENFIFFRISQITTFLSLRRLPQSKNVRFWYRSHLLSEMYKMSNCLYSFAKKC